MSRCKIFKFVFWQKYTTQKDENSSIELPVKVCIETMLFATKIISFEIFTFFSPGSLRLMSWTLSWPWPHICPIFKKVKHSSEPSRYDLLPSVYFYGPSFWVNRGGNIYLPPAPRVRLESPAPRGLNRTRNLTTLLKLSEHRRRSYTIASTSFEGYLNVCRLTAIL